MTKKTLLLLALAALALVASNSVAFRFFKRSIVKQGFVAQS